MVEGPFSPSPDFPFFPPSFFFFHFLPFLHPLPLPIYVMNKRKENSEKEQMKRASSGSTFPSKEGNDMGRIPLNP